MSGDRLREAREVAELLHVSVRWVRDHTRQGGIPHIRLGRHVRYDIQDVLAWVKTQKSEGASAKRP